MHFFFIGLTSLLLFSCIGPFFGRQKNPPWLSRPPSLQVRFYSSEAAARLSWERAPRSGFLRYEIQRGKEGNFTTIEKTGAIDDTSFVDDKLKGNETYRYRVVSYFSEKETEHALLSSVAEGGIHRYTNAWDIEGEGEEFLPTRLVVSRRGILSVVGAGSGRVARFDRAGNPLRELIFTSEPLACLETSTLDGPSLALDAEDALYVAFNVQRDDGSPQAFWSKFDADGLLLWSRPLEGLFARHIIIDGERIFIESISQLQQFDRNGEQQIQYIVPALLVSSLRFWTGKFAALIEPVSLLESDWQAPRLVVYEEMERQATGLIIGRDPTSPDDRGNGLLLRPTDFIVDEIASRSFVVNAGRNRIEVFLKDRFLTNWGQEGSRIGQFRFAGQTTVIDDMALGTVADRWVVAGGIARDGEGYIYVADTFNNRIQKFQP